MASFKNVRSNPVEAIHFLPTNESATQEQPNTTNTKIKSEKGCSITKILVWTAIVFIILFFVRVGIKYGIQYGIAQYSQKSDFPNVLPNRAIWRFFESRLMPLDGDIGDILDFSYPVARRWKFIPKYHRKIKVCSPKSISTAYCLNLERNDAQAICEEVEFRIDCANKLSRGEADFGIFTEEETLLLAHHAPNDNRVIGTIRDDARKDVPYAFEAVAVVPASYGGGFEGLKNGKLCHPGFDSADHRWSPRVLKAFERAVANSDRCPGTETSGKSADELEVEVLNTFFSAACRPGLWSANTTVDAALKKRYPNLCSLCSTNVNDNSCNGYNINVGTSVSGVDNNNRHIQALECLRNNGQGAVAYVAWQRVREFFLLKHTSETGSYAILCDDGNTRPLTGDLLASNTAPCSFVKQPWSTIVANTQVAAELSTAIKQWWPDGKATSTGVWQSLLFTNLIGGASARVNFTDVFVSPADYTATIRTIPPQDSITACVPARRWCTTTALEQAKCTWLQSAAHVLGLQPAITCATRGDVFKCFSEIKDNQMDLYVSSSNYGYLARQHYKLSPVKLVQNLRAHTTRVVALVKATAANSSITRFESLRGSKACFPEFGGIAYMAFVKAAQDRGVISATECDYTKAVGEFFDGACAGGAIDATHALTDNSDFNATSLCSVCKPATWTNSNNGFTCAWNASNLYFGNNGSLACLNDPSTQVAVLSTHNIQENLVSLQIANTTFRALCRNNTLAASTGVSVDDGCLLAQLTDAEIITRRNDPTLNALNVLLDTLEQHFGYAAENGIQLINFEMYSPFDGKQDLLFKDTAIGLLEPSASNTNEFARNYIELFKHLESCTGAAPGPAPAQAMRHLMSALTLAVMAIMTKFVIY